MGRTFCPFVCIKLFKNMNTIAYPKMAIFKFRTHYFNEACLLVAFAGDTISVPRHVSTFATHLNTGHPKKKSTGAIVAAVT